MMGEQNSKEIMKALKVNVILQLHLYEKGMLFKVSPLLDKNLEIHNKFALHGIPRSKY